MKHRALVFFEWVVVDNCNLNCGYCVNKGEFSQKPKAKMVYVPGREVAIARKIVELTGDCNRVIVNLTGGEPLISDYLAEVLTALSSANNMTVKLITNLKRIDKYADDIMRIFPSLTILGSLHVHFRTDEEIDRIINFLNSCKGRLAISLSQVDYDLTAEDREKLGRIKRNTGMMINFQTFIPPWTEDGKINQSDEVRAANFLSSLGKRCCLGYSHFFLRPDGAINYDLWCNDKMRKSADFLSLGTADLDRIVLNDMRKCPMQSCGCNYNTFNYPEYVAACKLLKYPQNEMFGRINQRLLPRLKKLARSYFMS